jgi:HEPN domain-containing protein
MTDALTIASSLRLAKGCAIDAAILAEQGSRNAAYLAAQALEQAIRAIATSEGVQIKPADAHRLDKIFRRIPKENTEKQKNLVSLVWLEAYATSFRYPLPSGEVPAPPERGKLAHAVREIRALVERLAVRFGVDLEDDDSPARDPRPIRSQL